MRSLIKYSLLALACLTISEVTASSSAIAGDRPVAAPDSGSSGISDTFLTGEVKNDSVTTARISRGLAEALEQIQLRQSVESLGGSAIALSSDDLALVSDAVSTEIDLGALEQQLMAELGGLEIEISALEVSSRNLASAVKNMNELVLSLDSEQLAAAIESPTFMSLLRLLEAANEAADEEGNLAVVSDDSSKRLLQVTRL